MEHNKPANKPKIFYKTILKKPSLQKKHLRPSASICGSKSNQQTQQSPIKPSIFLFTLSLLIFNTIFQKNLLAQEKLQDFSYWASLCNSLVKTQKYDDNTIKACDQAIAINPNDAQTWTDRGNLLFSLAKYAEAAVSFDQVLRQKPNNSLILAKLCGALSELGRQEEAIASCEKALQTDDNWGDATPAIAWHNRGIVLKKLNKPQEAIDAYDWAIKINPNYSPAWADRCSLLTEIQRYEEALVSCDKAIQAANWGNISPAIAWRQQGLIFRKLGKFDQAIAAYDRALALNPKDAKTWTEQGILLEKLGKHGEALSAYTWALKASPKSSETLVNQCLTLNRIERYEEALKACDLAIQEGDGNWGELGIAMGWNQRGHALTGMGNLEEALAAFNRAIALKPDYANAWSNRSVALWRMGKYDDALTSNQRAIELAPFSSQAWFNQGRILTTLGKFEDAVTSYERALKGDANVGDKPSLADIWVNQSGVLWRLERYEKAIVAADSAITLNPKSAEGWYNKGLSLMSLKRYEQAVTAYTRASTINPKNADFWAGKGIALRFLESYPEALVALEEALKINPNHLQAQQNKEYVVQKIKSITPVAPVIPATPVTPVAPVTPAVPVTPVPPVLKPTNS